MQNESMTQNTGVPSAFSSRAT